MVRISPGNTLATLCLLFLFGCTSSIPGVNNPPQQHHLRGPLNVFTTPENPFHENQIIPANAHVESDTGFVHFIYQTIKEATGAKASLTTGPHGVKVYVCHSSTENRSYSFAQSGYIVCEGLGSYNRSKCLTQVPYIPYAVAEPYNEDKAIVLVDTLRGRVFDIWGYNSTPGLFIKPPKPFCWYANGLSISSSGLYPSDIIGIGGSNVSFFNGAVWPEEIIAGEIKHPLKCWLPRKCIRYNFYCPPLTSSEKDQQTNHPYSIPEGTRLQLNPSINLDAYPLNHTEKVIARALQKYGMYLVDTNDPTLNGVVKSGLTILAVSGRSYLQNPYRLVPGFPPDLISNSHQYNYSFSNTFIELMKHLRIILAPVLPTADRVARSAINGSVMEYCN